jgi:hypothetical protein
MGNLGQICSEKVSTKTIFFEITNWRLLGCTPSLHDYVVLCALRWSMAWPVSRNGQDPYARIGKVSVSRNEDSSGTHVFEPKQ